MPEMIVIPIANKANQRGMRMWPLSPESVERIYDVAGLFLIIGLIIGVVSTVLIVWSGNRKEEYLRRDIANTMERAANAEQRAAEAELKLEQVRQKVAPRKIDGNAFLEVLKGKPKATVEIMYLKDDPDSINLSTDLIGLLSKAGWTIESWKPIPPENPEGEVKAPIPSAMAFGGQTSGITIVAKVIPETVGKELDIPFRALWAAIVKSTGRVYGGRDPSLPEGKLRIIVAPKEPWM